MITEHQYANKQGLAGHQRLVDDDPYLQSIKKTFRSSAHFLISTQLDQTRAYKYTQMPSANVPLIYQLLIPYIQKLLFMSVLVSQNLYIMKRLYFTRYDLK